MNKKIIYLKEVDSYDDIFKKEHKKMPLFLKKIIFLFKNLFNIITKKEIEGNIIWILPIKEKYSNDKIRKIIKNNFKIDNNIYVISNELKTRNIDDIMDIYNIKYMTEGKTKKIILLPVLEYIGKILKKDINLLDITIMVKDNSEINLFFMEQISKLVKSLKVVSLNIYKFRKMEEKLYNENGIAIQFSNSYKKSLEKSNIIINLDYSEIEINEYNIYNSAIIINCTEEKIKIKSRLFEGININSYEINFDKKIIDSFKKIHIYDNYRKFTLYASIIEKEENIFTSYKNLYKNKVKIISLVGNNGIIDKKEFKNVNKKSLTKVKKKSNIIDIENTNSNRR